MSHNWSVVSNRKDATDLSIELRETRVCGECGSRQVETWNQQDDCIAHEIRQQDGTGRGVADHRVCLYRDTDPARFDFIATLLREPHYDPERFAFLNVVGRDGAIQ